MASSGGDIPVGPPEATVPLPQIGLTRRLR